MIGARGGLRAELLRSGDVEARHLEAWRALARRALEPNPFAEPEYVMSLARPDYGGEITLLTTWRGSDLVALWPFYAWSLPWHGVPLPAWCVPNVRSSPLLDAETAAPAFAAAIDLLAGRWSPRRIVVAPSFPIEGPVARIVDDVLGARAWASGSGEVGRCPLLRRRPDGAHLDGTLHGNRRKNLRRARQHLERELGGPLRIVRREHELDAVERFLALEASGWKGREGTAMLSRGGAASWFRSVCHEFGAAGRLRLSFLEAGEAVIAMKADVAAGDGLFNMKTAYDERHARSSPGVLLEIEAVAAFAAETEPSFLDACSNYPLNPLVWLYPDGRRIANRRWLLGPP